MRRQIDLYSCILAWLFALGYLISSLPPYNITDWSYLAKYFLLPWVLCITCLVAFRMRPWKELWGVFLSVLLIGYGYTVPIFLFLCLVGLIWILHPSRIKIAFKLSNLDILCGVAGWVCAFFAMISNDNIMPWNGFNYLLTYGPISWTMCMLGMFFLESTPGKSYGGLSLHGYLCLVYGELCL